MQVNPAYRDAVNNFEWPNEAPQKKFFSDEELCVVASAIFNKTLGPITMKNDVHEGKVETTHFLLLSAAHEDNVTQAPFKTVERISAATFDEKNELYALSQMVVAMFKAQFPNEPEETAMTATLLYGIHAVHLKVSDPEIVIEGLTTAQNVGEIERILYKN